MFEILVTPTPEIDEVIREFVDDVGPGVKPSYFGYDVSPEAVDGLFRAAADLYRTAPWDIIGDEEHLLLLDAPWFGLSGAPISIIGSLGECRGLLVYEFLASFEAVLHQAERSEEIPPRRSEMCAPALSVTFFRADELPHEMVREAKENGWPTAAPDAYPAVLAFDPDDVARPLRERDCRLATACCLAVSRPVVTVAVPMPTLSGLEATEDPTPPS